MEKIFLKYENIIIALIAFSFAWISIFAVFDRHMYLGLHMGLIASIVYFFMLSKQQKLSWHLLLPLLPVAAIYLTTFTTMLQGGEDGDLHYAWMWLAVVATGMAAGSAFPRQVWKPMMLLPITLSLTFLYLALTGKVSMETKFSFPERGHNELGLLAGYSVLIYLGHLKDMSRKWKQWLFMPGILFPTIILAMTNSRNSILGLGGALLIYALFFSRRKKLVITICIIGALLFTGFTLSSTHRTMRMKNALIDPLNEPNLLCRLSIWDACLNGGFSQKPILGHEFSNFREFHKNYVTKHHDELKEKYKFSYIEISHPHNMYVGILFCWGLIGFLAFTVATGSVAIASFKNRYVFPFLALSYFALSGLLEFFIYRKDGLFIFFIVYGLAIGRHWAARDKASNHAVIEPNNI